MGQTDQVTDVRIATMKLLLLLLAALCPTAENPEGCENFVHQYWPGMNGPVTDFFLGDLDAACADACTRGVPRELTCEDCQNGLMRFSQAITDEVNIVDLITYMQGDAYCTSGMEVPDCTELPDCMCPNVVEGILPPIMKV